jgi:hypothetical protein
MRIIKYFALAILSVILFFLTAGLFISTKNVVEKTVIVRSELPVLHENLVSVKSLDAWFPWKEYDPEMKAMFDGNDGQIGSRYIWEGNDQVGRGYQELISISPNRIDYELTFIEPWESKALTYFTLNPSEDGVKVSWFFENESPYPYNSLKLFMDMEEMVGKDFERGLQNFKTRMETLLPEN